MKTLERALDVPVGEWEYFAGEVRIPRRGYRDRKRWRHKRRGEGELARYRKEGNWVLSSLPTPPALARAVSPSTISGSCMGISQALP